MGKHRKPEKKKKEGPATAANGTAVASTKQSKKPQASKLLFEPQPEWHTHELSLIPTPTNLDDIRLTLLEKFHSHAKDLLAAETAQYETTHQQHSSAHKFYTTIMTSGTWSDKVSALTLLVQESPLHNTKAFENLVGLAGKKSRQQALMALSALKDMLAIGSMLPSRKLRFFTKNPQVLSALQGVKASWTAAENPLPNGVEKRHMVLWAFEDWLKRKYFELLRIAETWLNDEVEHSRMRVITFVWELLKEKPEQEENLLRLVVNKLGDLAKKVASRASHLLLQLQSFHPSMKSIIIGAIESEVVFKSGQSSHAIYYAIITLNQTILSVNDPETANKLLDIYFGLFVRILTRSKNEQAQAHAQAKLDKDAPDSKKRKRQAKEGPDNKSALELNDKIIAQVLTGVNRAFPYSKATADVYEKHLDTLYRITHSSNFNTSIQALQLIQQISATHHITTDRFMRTLYESLLDPRLVASSKQTMYLNLLYRALKADPSTARVQAFVKRLLQTLSLHEPPFITAALFLILELTDLFPAISSMLSASEAAEDDEEEHYVDVPSSPQSSPEPEKAAATPAQSKSQQPRYDARKRDPLHAHAALAPLWDILPLLPHYHPSVSLFATNILKPLADGKRPPKPDAASHTLSHFLDRFAYRNPKTSHLSGPKSLKGTSLMQPALITSSTLIAPGERGLAAPVNTEAFWNKKAEDIDVSDAFFHKYFATGPGKKKSKKEQDEDEGSDWDSEVGANEGEIWKALVGNKEDAQEDGAEGSEDDDMDEFERMMDDESDDEEGDEGVELNLDSDEEDEEGGFDDGEFGDVDMEDPNGVELDEEAVEDDDDDDDEGGDPFGLAEDEEDIWADSDEEVEPPKKKGKLDDGKSKSTSRDNKKKLKALPTFASVEDYAKMIDDAEDPDNGEY